MPAGWPALGPIFKDDPNNDLIGGHPTSAGALDRDDRYPKLPADDSNQGSGRPGRPKYRKLAPTHGKVGGMLPGNTPNGPQQPGVDYDDGVPT
jgi:hypothetical protein